MIADFFRRIRYWFTGIGERADLEEEMRLHVALRAEKLEALGMNHGEAEAAARRRFGNQLLLHERSREMWISQWLDDLARDIRIGVRGLSRSPAFTIVALLTLALGIGANTAIFQLVDALRLRSLPVKDPGQLALIQLADRKGWRGSQVRPWPTLTNPQWEYFRDHQEVFSGVLAWSSNTFGLGTDPRPVRGLFVSGDFFRVLGVVPQRGRVFTPQEDRRGCGVPGAVLSHAFWQNEFAGDVAILGRKIILNQQAVEVVGVTGPEFTGLEVGTGFDVAVPICAQAALWNAGNWLDEGAIWWLTVVGRYATDQDLGSINMRLRASSAPLFDATLSAKYPRENAADYLKMTLRATPVSAGVSELREPYEDPLLLLLAATGLVLLLACANLGNMILARASTREQEFALRLSMGASRLQLLRQLMVENALLAVGGACAGLLIANILSRTLVAFLATEGNALLIDLRPDGSLIAFSTLVAVGCCAAFGLLPAWRAAHASESLKSNNRVTASRQGSVLRQVLVVAQVTLSLVLVFGALLFSRTLGNVLAVDAGFRSTGVLIAAIDYSRTGVPADARWNFVRELLERVRTTPGVASAAESDVIPLSGNGGSSAVWLEGSQRGQGTDAGTHFIGDGYMETMNIRILAGREFDRRDTLASSRVAIVNQTLARQLGLGQNPIGQRFRKEANPWYPETTFEIVGLVRDTKYFSLKEEALPIAYYSLAQDSDPAPHVQLFVRSRASESDTAATLRKTLKAKYPAIAIDVQRLERTIDDGLLRERLLATVSGFFGLLAAVIAAVGLYGVISYMVVRRTNEIGIRMALGARRSNIIQTVVSRATLLVAVGIVVGAVIGVAAAQAARSMLFGVQPYDFSTVVLAAFALIAVALAASCGPAVRAVRIDPLAALRRD
jgi:putative ABC transport system permease protein